MADDGFLPPAVAKLAGDDAEFAAMIDDAIEHVDRLKESLDEFSEKDDHARVGVDGEEEVKRQLDDLDARLDEYGKKREDASVGVDEGEGLGALASSIMLFGPALVPILAEATAGVVALSGSLVAGGIGAGAFAAVAYPAIKEVVTATHQLSGEAGVAQRGWDSLKQHWDTFAASFQPQVFQAMTAAEEDLQASLPGLRPIIDSADTAILGLAKDAERALGSPFWKGFSDWLGHEAGPSLTAWGVAGGNILHGLAALFEDFTPLINDVNHLLVDGTGDFAKWAEHLKDTKGFQEFLDYVRHEGPLVEHSIGAIVGGVVTLVKAFAPIGDTVLTDVKDLLQDLERLGKSHPDLLKDAAALTALAGAAGLLSKIPGSGSLMKLIGVGGPELAVIAALGTAFYEAYKHIKPFHDEVDKVGRDLDGDVGPAMDWITHKVLPDLKKEFGGTWKEIEKDWHEFLGGAVTWAKQEMDDFKRWWAKNGADIEEAAERIWGAIVLDVNESIRTFLKIAHDVMPGLKRYLGLEFKIIADAIEVVANVIDGHWKKSMDDLGKLAKDGIKLLMLPFNLLGGELEKLMKAAGKDVIDGLEQGIEDGIPNVEHLVESLGTGLWHKFKSAIGSASPSKKFRQSGHDIDDGVVLGIDDKDQAVYAAAQKLAKAASDGWDEETKKHTLKPVIFWGNLPDELDKYYDKPIAKDRNKLSVLSSSITRNADIGSLSGLHADAARDREIQKQLRALAALTKGLADNSNVMRMLHDATKDLTRITKDEAAVIAAAAAKRTAEAQDAANRQVGDAESYLALQTGVLQPTVVQHFHIAGSVLSERQLFRTVQKRALRHERGNSTNGLTRRR